MLHLEAGHDFAEALGIVDGAAKLARHFQSALKGEGELLLVANAQVARFGVQQGALRRASVRPRVVLLELVVRHHAIGNVPLDGGPVAAACDAEVFGHRQTDARHGASVDAQRLAAAAQCVVLELQGLLLAAHGEAQAAVFHIGIQLLHHGLGLHAHACRHVESVAYAPAACRVGSGGAKERGAHQSVVVNRRKAVAVGRKPQGHVARGGRTLHREGVVNVVHAALQGVLSRCLSR